MNQHTLGGLIVGVLALLVAATFAVQAVSTRRHRFEIAETYDRAGGPAYTAIQLGCAVVLAIFGIVLLVLVLLSAR